MSDYEFIDAKKVDAILEATKKSSIFTVVFETKEGSLRRMNCRRGVTKHLKGGKSTIKGNKNLVSVYDNQAQAYRCFDKTKVLSIKSEGEELRSRGFDERDVTILDAEHNPIKTSSSKS